jgi:hypothetical protein
MLLRLRKHLTYTNVALTLALVFAMSGGAYAAGKYLITSTKQISPKVLKALTGKPGAKGPAGPPGPAGPAGVKGENGAAGKEGAVGKVGANGESVTVKEVKANETACAKQGGSSLTVAGATTLACNGKEGKEGSPWTAGGTLPAGKTETGTYVVRKIDNAASEAVVTAISFAIPLASAIENAFIVEVGGTPPKGCTGTAAKPEALPGNLCVFETEALGHNAGLNPVGILNPTGGLGASTTGAELAYGTVTPKTVGEEVSAEGTWAVTG